MNMSLLEGSVEDVNLSELDEVVHQLLEKKREFANLEGELKTLKAEIDRYESTLIPEMMGGITQIKTISGATISVKEIIKANIKKEDRPKAFHWMDESGYGDLIKTALEIKYQRGELDKAKKTAKELEKMGLKVDLSEEVHWQTLNAWAREQYEQGAEFPEFIGIYTGKKAEVKNG